MYKILSTTLCALLGLVIIRVSEPLPPKKTPSQNAMSDTTLKPPVVYKRYVLRGSDTAFRVLIYQIFSPDDVTENQRKDLKKWLNSSILPDTVIESTSSQTHKK